VLQRLPQYIGGKVLLFILFHVSIACMRAFFYAVYTVIKGITTVHKFLAE